MAPHVIYISYNQQANSQEMQIAHNEDLDKNEKVRKQQEEIIKENTQKRERVEENFKMSAERKLVEHLKNKNT